MKKIFSLLLAFGFYFITVNAGDFVIMGNFDDIKSGTVHLSIYGEKQIDDNAKIINGAFVFKGTIQQAAQAILSLKDKPDYFTFYVEPGTINISGKAKNLKDLVVSNSSLNDDDKELKQRLQSITEWEQSNAKLYEQASNTKNEKLLDSLDQVDLQILQAKRNVVASFVKDHPHSLRSAIAIADNYAYYAEVDDVEPLFNLLDDNIKSSNKGKEIQKMIDVYKNVAVGKILPDITQPTPSGTLMSLSSLKGKYVLVDFWASWCPPCRRDNPNVVKIYDEYKDKGFDIFGVSYDSKKDKWEKAIKDDKLTWHQVSDLKGWKNATSDLFGIRAIPSNMLLDKEGRIIAKNIFGKNLSDKLSELLK